jgi:hypothetical protein
VRVKSKALFPLSMFVILYNAGAFVKKT